MTGETKRKFIAIGYLPSGDDYCMGCHMGSYDSDHEVEEFDTVAELAEWLAAKNAEPDRGPGAEGWETYVYLDGENFLGGDHPDEALADRVREMVRDRSIEIRRVRLLAEHENKKAAQALYKRDRKESRRRDYERLKKEFHDA